MCMVLLISGLKINVFFCFLNRRSGSVDSQVSLGLKILGQRFIIIGKTMEYKMKYSINRYH